MGVFSETMSKLRNTMLNLSPAEAKVMDACNNDKWGPSGTVMHEICDHTRYRADCEDVLNVLFMKLEETGRNWRMCYKALSCLEFMVGHGSDRSVSLLRSHQHYVRALESFKYVDPSSGKDEGLNVRKKSEKLLELLASDDAIKECRAAAKKTKNKFGGVGNDSPASFVSNKDDTGGMGYDNGGEIRPRKSSLSKRIGVTAPRSRAGSADDEGDFDRRNGASAFDGGFGAAFDSPAESVASRVRPPGASSDAADDDFGSFEGGGGKGVGDGGGSPDDFEADFGNFDTGFHEPSASTPQIRPFEIKGAASGHIGGGAPIAALVPPPSGPAVAPPPLTASSPAIQAPFAAFGDSSQQQQQKQKQQDPFALPLTPAPAQATSAFPQDPFAAFAGPPQGGSVAAAALVPPPLQLQQPDLFAAQAPSLPQPVVAQVSEDPFAFMEARPAPHPPTSMSQQPPSAVDAFDAFSSASSRVPQPADPFALCDNITGGPASPACATNGGGGGSAIWNEGLTKGILDLSLKSPDRSTSMAGAPMRRR